MSYWKKHILLFSACIFFFTEAHAQGCSIIANSKACVGEPVSFQVQTSGTVTSYAWDFSGEGTSSGAAPGFIFNTPGNKIITVVIGFSGGLSCSTSFQLKVNQVPQTHFLIDSVKNIYCRNTSLVCLDDLTQRSASNAPLKQRIIVWGDGALGQNLNPEGNREDCHHYYDTGVYEITMELTDTNLCKTTYRRNVTIVPDLISIFTYSVTNTCDSVKVCFTNTSVFDSLNPPHFRWYNGDGSVDSSQFAYYCRSYTANGSFRPSLVLFNKFGCYDSNFVQDLIKVDIPQIKLMLDKHKMCANGAAVQMQANLVTPADYSWVLQDSAGIRSVISKTGNVNSNTQSIPGPGKWYVYVMVQIGGCLRKSNVDTVIVLGPDPAIAALNSTQCSSEDTVRYCLNVDYYRSNPNNCRFFWDFGDKYSPQCTTDTRNNINVGKNCNYSLDSNSTKHFYKGDSCFLGRFFIIDTVSGCSIERKLIVSIGEPDAHGLSYKSNQPCFSIRRPEEYKVEFIVDSIKPRCGVSKIFINLDSAAGKNEWKNISVTRPFYVYDSIADDSGWVTVGLIVEMGSVDVYSECTKLDPNDVGTVCRDTVWYHRFLRLLPEPQPLFFLDKNHGCNPLTVNVSVQDSTQRFIQRVYYDWGDNKKDTVTLNPSDRLIPSFKHSYQAQGKYFLRVILENSNFCQHSFTRKVTVGYSKYLEYDTVVCAKQEVHFNDSIEYWDFITGWWRDTSRAKQGKEQVWWHFGDGASDSGNAPVHVYNDTGNYFVSMVSVDSVGCYDSSVYRIYVVGVSAGIKAPLTTMVCNEIVTFYDSSRKKGAYEGDSIVKYWWDFGDKKIPSVLKDATHAYSSFGVFTITHVVENVKGCRDTSKVTIDMTGPEPWFSFLTDSIGCVPFTVKLDNRSDTASIADYLWDFDDQNHTTISTQSDSNVSFTYTDPGTYYLKLTGSKNVFSPATGNVYYCKAVYPDVPTHPEKKVIVLPIPQADFIMPDTVCPGEEFNLIDNSDFKYKTYTWHFAADSLVSKVALVKYNIKDTGDHSVMYTPYYVPGPEERLCLDTVYKKIHVSPVIADFEVDTILSEDPKYFFSNLSVFATDYYWDFGQPGSGTNSSILINPSHNYDPDTGTFIVCLRAVNSRGCEDTVCKPVRVIYFPYVHYYNVFTPDNADSLNDVFDIDIKGESFYRLRIFNRWGNLVFQSDEDGFDNDGKNWNGREFNTGNVCPSGTYYYVFEYSILAGEKKRVFGTCTLLRDLK